MHAHNGACTGEGPGEELMRCCSCWGAAACVGTRWPAQDSLPCFAEHPGVSSYTLRISKTIGHSLHCTFSVSAHSASMQAITPSITVQILTPKTGARTDSRCGRERTDRIGKRSPDCSAPLP
eukprot:scaffold40159_cov41-Tisochrysis_lutea.AAC.1